MATKNQTNQELDLAALKKEKAKVIEALNKIQEIERNEYSKEWKRKNKEQKMTKDFNRVKLLLKSFEM